MQIRSFRPPPTIQPTMSPTVSPQSYQSLTIALGFCSMMILLGFVVYLSCALRCRELMLGVPTDDQPPRDEVRNG
jgi:hypothetical protein